MRWLLWPNVTYVIYIGGTFFYKIYLIDVCSLSAKVLGFLFGVLWLLPTVHTFTNFYSSCSSKFCFWSFSSVKAVKIAFMVVNLVNSQKQVQITTNVGRRKPLYNK
jgi:hypothetical protein